MELSAGYVREWISTRLEKIQMEDYYYSGGDTTKHYWARIMDRLLARCVVFGLITPAFSLYTGRFFVGIFFGGIITYLFDRLEVHLRRTRCKNNRRTMLENEAVTRFAKQLEGKSERGFFELTLEMLGKSNLFIELELVEDDEGRPLLITGKFKEEKIGVYADKTEKDQMVKLKDLKKLVEYCKNRGLKTGIYITNGHFDYASREYAINLDSFNLLIADKHVIYRAFLKKDYLFSMEELENELKESILERNQEAHHGWRRILAYRRIRTYTVLGALIAVYSVYVPYSFYYIFVAIVLFCLSLTALVRWKIEKYMEDAENSIKLDSVMDT